MEGDEVEEGEEGEVVELTSAGDEAEELAVCCFVDLIF
jgi:hypothetical protein